MAIDKKFIDQFVNVTSKAALASSYLVGKKDKISADSCFFCIGTTKKNSPQKLEYKRIELELPKNIAQICKSNGISSFVFVSSGFANPNHSGEYLRFKGLVEEELKSLSFENLGILRPSFLLGKRKQFRIFER